MSGPSDPRPPVPAKTGRVPFSTIYHKTAGVLAWLTAAVILLTEVPTLLDEIPRLGWRAALVPFAIRYTIKVAVASVFNCFALAPPIAGVIYYLHNVAEDR